MYKARASTSEPLLPPGKPHPLGGHNPRGPNRNAMDAILFVLRTGCQWNALDATGICSSSSAHRRFQEWRDAGVFLEFWKQGLLQPVRSARGQAVPSKGPSAGDEGGEASGAPEINPR